MSYVLPSLLLCDDGFIVLMLWSSDDVMECGHRDTRHHWSGVRDTSAYSDVGQWSAGCRCPGAASHQSGPWARSSGAQLFPVCALMPALPGCWEGSGQGNTGTGLRWLQRVPAQPRQPQTIKYRGAAVDKGIIRLAHEDLNLKCLLMVRINWIM